MQSYSYGRTQYSPLIASVYKFLSSLSSGERQTLQQLSKKAHCNCLKSFWNSTLNINSNCQLVCENVCSSISTNHFDLFIIFFVN